jgi:AraC-like DNA-binding protein
MRTSLLNLPQVQRIARTTCRRMARHAAIILAIPSALPHCHGAQRKPSGSARPSLSRTRNECGRAPIDGHGGGRLRRASNRFISGKATGLIGSVNDTMGVTMPGGAARTFADPYEYQAFTCDAQHRVVVTKAGAYRAKTIRIDLHRVMLRRARQALPTISHLAIPAGRSAICFSVDPRQTLGVWGGKEIKPGGVFVVHSGGEFFSQADERGGWASLSLSAEALAASAQALFGYDLKLPAAAQVARPPNTAMARLSALHKAAGDLAVSAPEILARAEVAQAIETELVRAAIGCLTDPVSVREPWTPRLKVMARFEAFVHANEERPLYITDICKGIGVSERTLRLHCLEHLGISPHRYLWLRRMHHVHRALASAHATATTVTEIATDHGFWELGRFSVAYKKLFGESPRATLRRAASDIPADLEGFALSRN